ncbi:MULTISPECIES: aminoglycoside N(3)-acetyltransferase [Streptomyces]|uniref:AAC(3) family N-acetyltransferase n=1 Tax=Streptomyces tsukubensis (strain DSM 42081 / NBRC 108919 / NRRL 18488 / 9993) TaxID=1114943 RepID=I2MVW8_STRT9|nr:AAC(3) family N-acetyltransferase [Streptomyces tsukubensis]MYS64081.1 aminoglycoside N(3)-acetyltransferase [Streptomyces sp. SID5473]AZK93371.1 AAC(3) family N-acetyltransferase [Streptomyces tsukubensis]EIF88915.1 Aminoglycoside N(3')-acetyltransferase [Streptomyces tsukubensis NRRL18488]QKM70473.1 AAC(3) family N-acetyltransferase [Streptomyces tsukubensis NRRL18488]TAI40488.1 AAC(3) family N-acetyltransferase [Streptomyces tsukubensis]
MPDPGLTGELTALGVEPGAILLVHAALRNTGLAADALRDALVDALGPGGTLVLPAFTPANSTTSRAHLDRIDGMSAEQVRDFRERMPAFDPAVTPSEGMGRLAESVRTASGAVRSAHPQTSFAALGGRAAELLAHHPLTSHLGWDSPLGALHRAGARVLMINVDFSACTAFHLAEYHPSAPRRPYSCVVRQPDGGKKWTTYEDVVLDDTEFDTIGADLPPRLVRTGQLGGARARLFPIKEAVRHADRWMSEKRR